MANSTHEPVRTMLAGTLDEQLLGTEINLSVYATNIYRLLGCQAGTDLESFNGRFDNFITRLKSKKPQRAMKAALKTGHEHLVDYDTTLQQLRNGMPSPNSRLIDELFWPHVNGPVIEALQTDAWLGQLTELVAPLAQDNRDDHEGAKARHAAAVLSHIAAITNQTQALKGESTFDPDLWACAREYWNRTLNDDVFWDYLSHRAKDLGASLLKAHDLQALRDRMPSVIQAFHLTIARSCFEKLDKPNVGSQHLEIFTDGQMPMTVTCGLRNLTQAWIGHQLKKPTDALKAKFDHVSGKIDYADAKTVVMEVIRRTREAWEQLSEQKQMAQLIIDAGAFDGIAQRMIDCVSKISIQNDDADRALLLRALTFKTLAQLPVSPAIKRSLDQNRRTAVRFMYGQVLNEDEDAQQFDPTVCFFADGAEADPDASIVLHYHKVTQISCVNIAWKNASLLVPRSKMAQTRHRSRATISTAAALAQYPELADQHKRIQEKRGQQLHEIDIQQQHALDGLIAERNAAIAMCNKEHDGHRRSLTEQLRNAVEETKGLSDKVLDLDKRIESRLEWLRSDFDKKLNPLICVKDLQWPVTWSLLAGLFFIGVIASLVISKQKVSANVADWLDSIRPLVAFRGLLDDQFGCSLSQFEWQIGVFGVVLLVIGVIPAGIAPYCFALRARRQLASLAGKFKQLSKEATRELQITRRSLQDQTEKAEQVVADLTQQLAALDAQLKAVSTDHQMRIDMSKRSFDCQRQRVEADATKQLTPIEAKAIKNINVRPESDQDVYPAIQLARRKEFMPGQRPDSDQCQRKMSAKMDALIKSLDRSMLEMVNELQNRLSNEHFTNVVEKLEAIPKHRRTSHNLLMIMRGDDPLPQTTSDTPQQNSTSSMADRCPKCGFSYGWQGTVCTHCNYRL